MQIKKNLTWFILIFMIALILLLKLFMNVRFYGHDTLFHAGNIINLSKTISFSNIFGDNLIKLSTNPFGYGTWLFYPKIPHLFATYVYLIFKDVYFSMSLVYFVVTFFSGIVMFCLSKKMFNCPRVAFLSALVYLTFSYHLCEIYIRDAFAENFMFLVVPMIFLGLYELKDNNYSKFYLLFISGYVIGMYSHLVTMVFCTIYVFLFLIYYRKIFFTKTKLKCLTISTLIVTGLVCPFLTSIFEHKFLGNYVVFTKNFSSKDIIINNIFPLSSYFNHDKSFNHNNILVYLNYSTIILFFITFTFYLFKKNRKNFFETRKLLLYAILLFIMFINSKSFWENMFGIFNMLQFSWRLVIFLCCAISLYVPLCFIYKLKSRKVYYIIYSFLVIIMIFEGLNNIYYYGNEEYSFEKINQSKAVMGWQLEYLPSYANNLSFHNGDVLDAREYQFILTDPDAKIEMINDNFPNMQFDVSNVDDYLYVEIPRIYYLGYELYDGDGDKISIFQSDCGFLATKINKDGVYTLKYVGTIYSKLSNYICFITLLGLFIWGGYCLWKKRKLQF